MSKKAILIGLAAAGIAAVAYNHFISIAEDDFDSEDYVSQGKDAEPITDLLKKAVRASDEDISNMAASLHKLGIDEALELVDTSNGKQERFFLQTCTEFLDVYVGHCKGHVYIRKVEDSNGDVLMREVRIAL